MNYIVYESYNDEMKQMKSLDNNTRILGCYEDLDMAIKFVETYLDDTITKYDEGFDWFFKEKELDLVDNKNIIKVYDIFNGSIENYNEYYTLIVEKVEYTRLEEVEDNE